MGHRDVVFRSSAPSWQIPLSARDAHGFAAVFVAELNGHTEVVECLKGLKAQGSGSGDDE